MKSTNTCKVNIIDSTITVTKAFAKKAGIIGTPEYKEMVKLRKAYPGFSFVQRTSIITANKNNYCGLTFEEMCKAIIDLEGEDSPKLKVLKKAKANRVSYPKMKKWFLDQCPNYGKDDDPVMPELEVEPHMSEANEAPDMPESEDASDMSAANEGVDMPELDEVC